jgi:hypothetical protein
MVDGVVGNIIDDDDIFLNARWTDDERTTLFEYYLGPEADKIFDKLKSNASHTHEKVVSAAVLSLLLSNSNLLGIKKGSERKIQCRGNQRTVQPRLRHIYVHPRI